jgi:hypothetical protein
MATAQQLSRGVFFTLLLACALSACALVFFATQERGLGVCPDGRTYLTTARLITEGEGVADYPRGDIADGARPMTQFPPLYPLLLASGRMLGLSDNGGARILQLALCALNVVLLGCFVMRASGSQVAGVTAAAWAGASPAFLYVHMWVWSEPLCHALLLGCLWALLESERGSWRKLALSALLCGLALLTRYAALGLLFCALILVLARTGETRARLMNAALFAAIALLPFVLWSVRNAMVAGRAVGHEHKMALMGDELARVAATALDWALPLPVHWSLKAVAAALLAGCIAWILWRQRLAPQGNRAVVFGGWLALAHFFAVISARRMVGTAIPLNDRILGTCLLGLIAVGASAIDLRKGRAALAAAIWAAWLAGSVWLAKAVAAEGLEYFGANWR